VDLNGRAAVGAVLCALALALPAAAGTVEDAARYLQSRQTDSGGFAEPNGAATPGLTAWATIALRAAGRSPAELAEARAYLERALPSLGSVTDVELVAVALAATGPVPEAARDRIRAAARVDGRIGPTVNATIWGILALRAAGETAPTGAVRFVLAQQRRNGGWSWHARAAPDSNDTAAAIQALRAAGVAPKTKAIRRGVSYLRGLQNRDGGFELVEGRGSDAQSTAWAIQALLAAGERPGAAAYAYLRRMARADGSFRYSARYAVTPVWVTAQAVPALARKPLPLRPA